jgi:phosphogluconate dehydratase
LDVLVDDFDARPALQLDLTANTFGIGRELFEVFRQTVGDSTDGAGVVV